MLRRLIYLLIFSFFCIVSMKAQITGTVIDSRTHEPLDYVNVYYDQKGVGGQTDAKGKFLIPEHDDWKELTISSMGYITQVIKLKPGKKNVYIRLVPSPHKIKDIVITARKSKYSRKNNPSVEFMKKVIAHKKMNDLHNKDYFSYTKYEKMVSSVNNITQEAIDTKSFFKKFEFLSDQVERCPQTDKLILPLTLNETVSDIYYRKHPSSQKTLIKAEKNSGMTTLFQTGDIVTTALEDIFTDVDIYQDVCRLFQYPFTSPIADNAISFYRYYIQDTTYIDNDRVIQVAFIANNQQDFSFTGHLYVMDDSTYQIRRAQLRIPGRSDINYIESMNITQDYTTLPTGERVMESNDMLVELKLVDLIPTGVVVQRTTRNTDYRFDSIPDKTFNQIKGKVYKDLEAEVRPEAYWEKIRPVELSKSEKGMGKFMDNLTHVKGFKPVFFVFKTIAENFVETGDSAHNYVDIGPINTIVHYNHYDGLRFRMSALTNANLFKHLYGSAYVTYGTKTHNVYGKGTLTYSFNRKLYLPSEFPMHNLSLMYQNDIISPFDKFLTNDKDNMFLAIKSSKNDQYVRNRVWKLHYEHEMETGFSYSATLTSTRNTPVDCMFYQALDGTTSPSADPQKWIDHMNMTEARLFISFEPGAKYTNTKQHRLKVNKDAPIFSLSHTFGLDRFLGGQFNYNITEAEIYKRIWLPHAWGKIDLDLKGGVQWNKVPYPMLILPPANQSFIKQKNTFELINTLEFMNDRYALLFFDWDLNGKIFNRIPLFHHLKWRESIGCGLMWGELSSKNNPATSGFTDSDLYYFPGHFQPDGTFRSNTQAMSWDKPYAEVKFSISNIFKLFTVEYVRRLSYLDNPDVKKHGVRFQIKLSF